MLLNTPRWPAKVISSPSGPWTMLTPGVSVSRSSNLRPRFGVCSTVIAFRVVAAAVRVDSTTLGDERTVTVSEIFDTGIAPGSVTVCPTFTWMFSCTSVAKPASVKVTS